VRPPGLSTAVDAERRKGVLAVEVLVERCAGLDVGKADLKACVRVPGARGRRQEIRTFATTTRALLELREWLEQQQVTVVGMEATGDYWKPVYYLLEDALQVQLLNAAHMHNVPGRKTDLLTELPDRIPRASPPLPVGVARLRGHGQRRGCTAGSVAVGGAAVRVA
jgi:hypothetical protein